MLLKRNIKIHMNYCILKIFFSLYIFQALDYLSVEWKLWSHFGASFINYANFQNGNFSRISFCQQASQVSRFLHAKRGLETILVYYVLLLGKGSKTSELCLSVSRLSKKVSGFSRISFTCLVALHTGPINNGRLPFPLT